jgi:hypothetical protein
MIATAAIVTTGVTAILRSLPMILVLMMTTALTILGIIFADHPARAAWLERRSQDVLKIAEIFASKPARRGVKPKKG